jgi:hypothetical protein
MMFVPADDLQADPVFCVRVYRDGSAIVIADEDPPKPRRTRRWRVLWLRAPNARAALARARNLA